ncbi:MAG: hypothetical protein ACREH8_19205 [Opitutaceae bacterium]
MPLLHTALQEGFSGEEVVVRVGGREVLHQSGVKTRTQIGLAATHEVQVPPGPVSIQISLPGRTLDLTVPLQVTKDTYLGVSVSPEGKIRHTVTHEPFGYV